VIISGIFPNEIEMPQRGSAFRVTRDGFLQRAGISAAAIRGSRCNGV
jgi:hypothetical protein